MGKLIFWIIVIFAVLLVLRMFNLRQQKKKHQADRAPGPSAAAGQPMVRCARCGVYLPRSDALLIDGTLRCHDKDCA